MPEDPFFAPYDEAFWRDHGKREYKDAGHKVGRLLFELTGGKGPVVDVGCGSGEMLRAIDEMGARPVLGLDSAQGLEWCLKLGIQELENSDTKAVDLRTWEPPFYGPPSRASPDIVNPNLVICIEVMEHLPEDAATRVVERICKRLNPTWIALSGARPGQGGTGHINEQQPLYWMNLVHGFGTHWFDAIASDEFHRRAWGTFPWSDAINLYRRME
ncbi:MAG: class I SAM-dependent methyltransferase [Thermoplasmata archaeon]|nr:class I SAM-dependent methyltransferase [Thermoplasmata archaeon]